MASKGGWVGSQEKFGWVCTAFEPLPCLKIIYFTTLLKTRDLFSRGGTLGISGWGCAAGTLQPLTYTRASSAEFCYPILE